MAITGTNGVLGTSQGTEDTEALLLWSLHPGGRDGSEVDSTNKTLTRGERYDREWPFYRVIGEGFSEAVTPEWGPKW